MRKRSSLGISFELKWPNEYEYHASLYTVPRVKFDGISLHLDAASCDVVYAVHLIPSDDIDTRLGMIEQGLRMWIVQELQSILHPPKQVEMGTMVLRDPRCRLIQPEALGFTLSVGRESYFSRQGHRALVGTPLGFTCLAPNHVRPGDEVIVPYGSSLPVIVRQCVRSHTLDSGARVYTLIGECYVDGIMNGELIDLAKKNRVEIKTFELI